MKNEMEKITEEELMKELKLKKSSDEELEKVVGGSDFPDFACLGVCLRSGNTQEFCERECGM